MECASHSVQIRSGGDNLLAAEHLAVKTLGLFFLVLGFRLLQSVTREHLVQRGMADPQCRSRSGHIPIGFLHREPHEILDRKSVV